MSAVEPSCGHPRHAAVYELLPWYVNGTLDEADRAEVQQHLGECLVCVREARRLEALDRAMRVPAPDLACERAFNRLSGRIAVQNEGPGVRLVAFWNGLRGLIAPVPLVAGAALLVCSSVLVTAIVLGSRSEFGEVDQPFQTLGSHDASAAARAQGPLLRVVLSDAALEQGIEDWVGRHQATVVDGPSEIGVMTIRLTAAGHLEQLVDAIRADDATLFVEPLNRFGARPARRR